VAGQPKNRHHGKAFSDGTPFFPSFMCFGGAGGAKTKRAPRGGLPGAAKGGGGHVRIHKQHQGGGGGRLWGLI